MQVVTGTVTKIEGGGGVVGLAKQHANRYDLNNNVDIYTFNLLDNLLHGRRRLPGEGEGRMPRIVSSSEAKSHFGELVKWTAENQEQVIVKLYGEPAAVIMSYQEYAEVEKLRKREQKRKALEALDALRAHARQQDPELGAEEAYRRAGFSAETIRETMEAEGGQVR
jgi:prevent-host-death family protein